MCIFCTSRKMHKNPLKNASTLAIGGVHTAENRPSKECQHLPKCSSFFFLSPLAAGEGPDDRRAPSDPHTRQSGIAVKFLKRE